MKGLLWMLAVGCINAPLKPKTSPEPATQQAAPTDPSQTESDCMKLCMQQNMARSIAIDVIEADCERACAPEKKEALTEPVLHPDL